MNTSNLQIMRALLAKDWRFFRVPMIALLIVGLGCYLFAGGMLLILGQRSGAGLVFYQGSVFAIGVTALLASAFGGMAIAGEQSDRTADFLGLLPVTRLQVLLSKWLVSLFVLGACTAFHVFVAVRVSPRIIDDQYLKSWACGSAMCGGSAICFFGIAWLFSTFTKSGPISACISIGVTIAVIVETNLLFDGRNHTDFEAQITTAVVTAITGMVGLTAGTSYYLRRVAP